MNARDAKTGTNVNAGIYQYASITEIAWYGESGAMKKQKGEKGTLLVKFFLFYVDDIVRTLEGEPIQVIGVSNSLHPNLQFLLEETIPRDILLFLDLSRNEGQDKAVTCSGYQKPTDFGIILSHRGRKKKILLKIRFVFTVDLL